MCVASNAQITQNKKFVISLQYLKKKVNDKIYLFHAGKHKNSLQIDTMILIGWSGISKVPKIASLQYVYNISK